MKKLFTLFAFVATIAIFAQAPKGFNYQATVRNSSGALITNQNVYFKFNVMLNSATSVPVYSETHYVPTDDLGQVNCTIGQGTASTGTFATINWGTGNYYLGIEINTGNGYVSMGTTQLLSVPYALYANSSGNSNFNFPNGTNIGDTLNWIWSGSAWVPTATVATAQLPVISTIVATNTLTLSPSSGGTITSDGGYSITSKGVCWSTSPNPTINSSNTNNGTGASNFISVLSNLLPATTYYYRAYATNSIGTAYGITYTFTTADIPKIITTVASSITNATANSGGTISSDGGATITAKGVCWSTSPNPTVALTTQTSEGTGTATFTSNIYGLTLATTYYVRAYATNSIGTAYGTQITFTTADIPKLTTTDVSAITSSAASSGGTISSDGGATITAKGVHWSTSPNSTSAYYYTNNGTGASNFTSDIINLNPGTTYYVRAYATNIAGTAYGAEIRFATLTTLPSIATTAASAITSAATSSGGTISSDGGATLTAKGVCWSTSPNPTVALTTKTSNGNGTATFTSNITGLTPGTTYYVRAYATNSVGTAYGQEEVFTTLAVLPSLTTTASSSITSATASSGGTISSDGGAAITAKGVCWSTSPNPKVALTTKTSDGTGVATFTSNITGLSPVTTYYVRAYATNSIGTAYGTEITFTTLAILPSLTTTTVSSITSAAASSGGTISSDGGAAITAKGVCWSTSPNPTVALTTKTSDGTGTATFTSNITSLTPGTTYYVRAYATNSIGTAYGAEITITTTDIPKITTTAASAITSAEASSGGTISSDGGATITAKGVCWSTSPNPTVALTTKTSNGNGTANFTSDITGLNQGTTYYLRAYATNSIGTAYGNEITFNTLFVTNVTIGTQIWQTGNLDVTTYRDGTPIPQVTNPADWKRLTTGAWCYYENTTANGTTYGKLYNSYAVAGIHDKDPNTPNKVLAPTGWHVPTDAEWNILTDFLGGRDVAGNKLKTTGTALWKSPNAGATNSSGFGAIPGGRRGGDGTFGAFEELGNTGWWWSSSQENTTYSWSRNIYDGGVGANASHMTFGFSVRCLKD